LLIYTGGGGGREAEEEMRSVDREAEMRSVLALLYRQLMCCHE
jgi:hypothetical protein